MTAAGWVTSRPIGAVRGAVAAGRRGRHSLARPAEQTPTRTDQAALCWERTAPGAGASSSWPESRPRARAPHAAGRPRPTGRQVVARPWPRRHHGLVVALPSWLRRHTASWRCLPEEGPLRRDWEGVGVIVEMNEYTVVDSVSRGRPGTWALRTRFSSRR